MDSKNSQAKSLNNKIFIPEKMIFSIKSEILRNSYAKFKNQQLLMLTSYKFESSEKTFLILYTELPS